MTQKARKASLDAPSATTPAGVGIGSHLRLMRRAHGLRLKEVAERAACSEGLMSRIETGKVEPSLRLLHRICAALDMKVGDLLTWSERPDGVVVRAADRVAMHFRDEGAPGAEIERLSLSGRLLMGYLNRLAPGASTGEPLSHPGEELGYVISGRVDLRIGDIVHALGEGDSFCFASDTPHSYHNPSESPSAFVIVNAPPSF